MIRTANLLVRRIPTSNNYLVVPPRTVATMPSSSSSASSSTTTAVLPPSRSSFAVPSPIPRASYAPSRSSYSSYPGRPFSSTPTTTTTTTSDDAASRLGSILQREINEETEASSAARDDDDDGGGLPPELRELRDAVSTKWTILEGITGIADDIGGREVGSGATVRMLKRGNGSKGARIGIVFHCQDTEEDSDFDTDDLFDETKRDEEENEENEDEEPMQAVRFGVVVSKGGRTVVIQCRSGYELSVDGVTVRDGDMETVLVGLAGGEGLHAALYQGPEFTELAEDLQESFRNYVVTECGVDDDVTAFISMYCDYREQEEYVSWMKTAIDILD